MNQIISISAKPIKRPTKYRGVASIFQDGGYKGKKYFRGYIPAKVLGKAWKKSASSLAEIKTLIDKALPALSAKVDPLEVSEVLAYREAVAMLPKGISLGDAVRSYLKHNVKDSPTLGKAIEIYLAFQQQKGVRRVDNIGYNLAKFAPLFSMRLCEISSEDVGLCLEPHKDVASTFKSYRNCLNTFFRWAIVQEYAIKNPVSKLVNPRDAHKAIEFYSPEQVLSVLATAKKFYPESVPYYLLCFFSGIRPQTVERLDWAMLDFDKRQIFIAERINKTNYSYMAHIPENLVEWLKPYRKASGAIIPDGIKFFRNRSERKVRQRLTFPWIQDVARHSFVTYSFELFGLETTLSRMGDKSPYTLCNHYKGLSDKPTAERFFALLPTDLENVTVIDWKKPIRGRPKNRSKIIPENSEIA